MIKVIYGCKGIGKTKYLMNNANTTIKTTKGDVVFIDKSKQLLTELRHEIRYINLSEFPINTKEKFIGLICGIIAQDYDLDTIYVDETDDIIKSKSEYELFFNELKDLSEKYKVNFTISLNDDISNVPDFVKKEYTC